MVSGGRWGEGGGKVGEGGRIENIQIICLNIFSTFFYACKIYNASPHP